MKKRSCFSIRQRYNLKANHNRLTAVVFNDLVVFQYVKDTIWKQITTPPAIWRAFKALFFNTSKIQFESKSQLRWTDKNTKSGCFSIRQRYNLKANHNCRFTICIASSVVFQYVKDTIWKQITTTTRVWPNCIKLFFNTSKIQFESKSQPCLVHRERSVRCFSIRQRYNLKANHNRKAMPLKQSLVVFQYVKDTIWKQITTFSLVLVGHYQLFFNTSKIQFESKSQPTALLLLKGLQLFFNTSKIQFESKSQLSNRLSACGRRCFSIRQRYNLKANHNCRGALKRKK